MKDTHFQALAHERRRAVLLALYESDGSVTLDLAPTETADDETYAMEMHHRHLPMLQTTEFVSFDTESGEVGCGARFDELRPALDAIA